MVVPWPGTHSLKPDWKGGTKDLLNMEKTVSISISVNAISKHKFRDNVSEFTYTEVILYVQ